MAELKFNEAAFKEKLRTKLDGSSDRIQGLSSYCCMYQEVFADKIAAAWDEVFRNSTRPDSKLNLLYLVNDVVQTSRKRGMQYVNAFNRMAPNALLHLTKHTTEPLRTRIIKLGEVWVERNVFGATRTNELKSNLASLRHAAPQPLEPVFGATLSTTSTAPPQPTSSSDLIPSIALPLKPLLSSPRFIHGCEQLVKLIEAVGEAHFLATTVTESSRNVEQVKRLYFESGKSADMGDKLRQAMLQLCSDVERECKCRERLAVVWGSIGSLLTKKHDAAKQWLTNATKQLDAIGGGNGNGGKGGVSSPGKGGGEPGAASVPLAASTVPQIPRPPPTDPRLRPVEPSVPSPAPPPPPPPQQQQQQQQQVEDEYDPAAEVVAIEDELAEQRELEEREQEEDDEYVDEHRDKRRREDEEDE